MRNKLSSTKLVLVYLWQFISLLIKWDDKQKQNIHICNYILRIFLTVAQYYLKILEAQHNKTSHAGFNQLAKETFFLYHCTIYRCPRRKGPNFGRVFLRSNYTDITQNTYIQSPMFTEILAREVWNFDSYYSFTDYQIHIETGRNMWFL